MTLEVSELQRKEEDAGIKRDMQVNTHTQICIHIYSIKYSAHKSTPTRTPTFTSNICTETHNEIIINTEF